MTFSASIFASIFHRFFMENGSKMAPKDVGAEGRFRDLFATFSEGRLFDAFGSLPGSLLAPFWRSLAPFGFPLAHFWLPGGSIWGPTAFQEVRLECQPRLTISRNAIERT